MTANTIHESDSTNKDPFAHLEMLPRRPRPEELVSLRSFLAHVGHVNSFRERWLWSQYIFQSPMQAYALRDILDFDTTDIEALFDISREELEATTVKGIQNKFNWTKRQLLINLAQIRANHLRYCPLCLELGLHHKLTWQFYMLPGCDIHGCYFWDSCFNCGHQLPLFPKNLQLGMCENCESELKNAPTAPLSEVDQSRTKVRIMDLIFLLKINPPRSANIEEKIIEILNSKGSDLLELRRVLKLKESKRLSDPASRMTFKQIFDSANYLGMSLRQLFAFNEFDLKLSATELDEIAMVCRQDFLQVAKQADAFEEILLQKAKLAIAKTQSENKAISFTAVSDAMNFDRNILCLYPSISQAIDEAQDEMLMRQVEIIVGKSADNETPQVTLRLVSVDDEFGVGLYLSKNDRSLKRLLTKLFGDNNYMLTRDDRGYKYEDLKTVTKRLENILFSAERHGQILTKLEIAQATGVDTYSVLKEHSQLNKLVNDHFLKRIKKPEEKRQSEKPSKVKFPKKSPNASQKTNVKILSSKSKKVDSSTIIKVQQLLDDAVNQAKKLSFRAVAQDIGLSASTVCKHPELRALVLEHKARSLQRASAVESIFNLQILQLISDALMADHLPTLTEIAELMQISIRRLIEALKSQELLDQYLVRVIAQHLNKAEEQKHLLTVADLARLIGIPRNTLLADLSLIKLINDRNERIKNILQVEKQNELQKKVQEFVAAAEIAGKMIGFKSLVRHLKEDRKKLRSNSVIAQIINEHKDRQRKRLEALKLALKNRVKQILIEAYEEQLSLKEIARRAEVTYSTLKNNAQIWKILAEYKLLTRKNYMQDALNSIDRAKKRGEFLSFRKIASEVGINVSTIHRNSKIYSIVTTYNEQKWQDVYRQVQELLSIAASSKTPVSMRAMSKALNISRDRLRANKHVCDLLYTHNERI